MQIDALSFPTEKTTPPVRLKNENVSQTKTDLPKERTEIQATPEKTEKNDDFVKLEKTLAEHDISIRFSQDEETNKLVVCLVNETTGEAVLQLPSEVSLKLSADFIKLQGQFVDKTVK